MPNYSQPDFRVPQTDPRVGVQVENQENPLAIIWPIPSYIQTNLDDKIDPSHNIRSGKSGKGGPG